MSDHVYLNGSFVPYGEACVPVEDRGYQFADGLYEVVQVVRGRLFAMVPHLERLEEGAAVLRIPVPLDREQLTAVARRLIESNQVTDGIIYIQLTRGVATRTHAFPASIKPTLVMMARNLTTVTPARIERGVPIITVPDNRWGLCYIKTVGLVPNILAKQKAVEAGAFEAVFVRDGLVTEGSSSNLFAVKDGVIWTHPLANILPGITRRLTIEVCRAEGIEVREQAFSLDWMLDCDEVFVTGTTTSLVPVVSVDGRVIGGGVPGPVHQRALSAYRAYQERAVGEEE